MVEMSIDPQSPDVILTSTDAIDIHNHCMQNGDLLIWTLTVNTSDYPHHVVARPHNILLQASYRVVLLADSLDEMRKCLPPNLHRFPRSASDAPVIVETWI